MMGESIHEKLITEIINLRLERDAAIQRGDTYRRRALVLLKSLRLERKVAVSIIQKQDFELAMLRGEVDRLTSTIKDIAATTGRNGHTASNIVLYARDVLEGTKRE